MSKARVAVLHVVSGQLTVTAAAKSYGLSRQHLHRLLKRYREGGLEAVDPRSRRPASNPRAVSDDVIIAIVGLHDSTPVSPTSWPPTASANGGAYSAITLHALCPVPT
jgi:hypothetical protein